MLGAPFQVARRGWVRWGVWCAGLMVVVDVFLGVAVVHRSFRSVMLWGTGERASYILASDDRRAVLEGVEIGRSGGVLGASRIESAGRVVVGKSWTGFPFRSAGVVVYGAGCEAGRATLARSLSEREIERGFDVSVGGAGLGRGLGNGTGWTPWEVELGGGVVLMEPSLVRWWAVVGNALFAFGAGVLVSWGVWMARWRWRVARGWCGNCGYAAVGLVRCPECGARAGGAGVAAVGARAGS